MTRRPFDQILSIEDLKTTADRLNSFYFMPQTLKFHDSRVSEKIYVVDDSTGYFVTSERHDNERRRYTVRRYDVSSVRRESDGRMVDKLTIVTFGGYHAYESARRAHVEAKKARDAEKYCRTN